MSESDAALASELTGRGHRVRAAAWNVAPLTAFTSADLVVLRSNWDYHHDLRAFERWLGLVERSPAELQNPASLVRPHLHKSYLERLRQAGVRTPRTLTVSEGPIEPTLAWIDDHELERLVVKPAWGASGHGVELVDRAEMRAWFGRWASAGDRRPMLVQEFVPEVAAGEVALVYFGGDFSHALLRRPAAGDFRVNGGHGGTTVALDDVDPALIAFGTEVQAALPEPATYARIDVVSTEAGPIVMEVEVNEPGLGLHLAPGSAARFATALVRDRTAGRAP